MGRWAGGGHFKRVLLPEQLCEATSMVLRLGEGLGGPKHSYWLVLAIKTYTYLSVYVFVVKVFSDGVSILTSK